MNLVIDNDALPETCSDADPRGSHVPGCPGMAGGDHEYVTAPLSMLRCDECGDLLDGYGACDIHGPLDIEAFENREGDPAFNGAFDRW